MSARHPVLRAGDTLCRGGALHTVVALDAATVRLADVTGTLTEIPLTALWSDPGVELVSSSRVPMVATPALDGLPDDTAATARWWEHHLLEVITGLPPDSPPGARPRPEYDPGTRSLRRRELAKHAALLAEGHQVGLSTLKRLRARYERDGLWGVVDQRSAAARPRAPGDRLDPHILEATRRAIGEETDRSTGTVARLRRRVEQLLAEQPDPPPMPAVSTFYRLVGQLSAGKHTFGSARTRRSTAKAPHGPFGGLVATRPGEWVQIDSTPLDVRVVFDDGTIDRVELTGMVDQATRTIPAAVLRPTTKAVDAALLLARALTPEPMRPGWRDALRLTRSVLPHHSLTAIDARLAHAAARPVIAPETIVCDHGKAYLSTTFRTACRTLGISLQPAHPDTPTDKPVIESTLGSVGTLFAQYVAGYVGSSVERRGKNAEQHAVWSMLELQALLDEWIVAVWQNRPHDGLRDPITPGQALSPNEAYAALVTVAGYVPVPLGPDDYIQLLPTVWRAINAYGITLGRRTYDSDELNPYRRQHSGIDAHRGRWEVHHDPYDISRVWIRNHHHGGWLSAVWKHLHTAPVPFGETAWRHARDLVAARGSDPVTEAEIATAAAELLTRAENGPSPTAGTANKSTRSRRVRGRTAATTAATSGPGSSPGPSLAAVDDPATSAPNTASSTSGSTEGPDANPQVADGVEPDDRPAAPVVALPLFDARKEAEKWW